MAISKGLLPLLVLTLLTWQAEGGNRVGNGGDIVNCGKESTILDFWEVWRFKGPMQTEAGDTDKIILEKIISRLGRVAPDLASQYRRRAQTIFDDIDFSDEVKPIELKDSLHAYEPQDEKCKVQQLAIRIGVPPAGAKRFIVHKGRYQALSPAAQAGLIMHEIIYEHLGRLGESDSRRVRKLVAHLFAPQFASETKGAFWLFIKNLKVPIYP